MKSLVLSASAALLALTVTSPVLAHARLVSADPAINGVARGVPARLHLLFSEAVSGKLSGVSVSTAGGSPVPVTASVDQNGKGLTAIARQPLRPGAYTVSWHAVASDDGHRTAGTYHFWVQ